MCTPELSLITQGAGVGMSTVGAFMGAKAQKSALRSQAVLADINARTADGNARNAIYAGVVEESRMKLRGSQIKGAQIAEMAGSGIDIAGSPTAIARLSGTDLITEVDANQIRANALRAAWNNRIDAGNQRSTATSLRATAASISPAMAGLTSLIGGASQVAASWYSMNKEGAFAPQHKSGTASIAEGDDQDLLDIQKWMEAGGAFKGPVTPAGFPRPGSSRPSDRGDYTTSYGRGY